MIKKRPSAFFRFLGAGLLGCSVLMGCGKDSTGSGQSRLEGPPAPRTLRGEYDPGTGVVKLSWPKVRERGLMGYVVYYSTSEKGLPMARTRDFIADTFFIDTVFQAFSRDTAGIERMLFYRVKSIDSNWLLSGRFSDSLVANLPNARALRPQVEDFASNAFNNRSMVGDPITLSATLRRRRGTFDQISWKNPAGETLETREKRLSDSVSLFTAQYIPSAPGIFPLSLFIRLKENLTVAETLRVSIYSDPNKCKCVAFRDARGLGETNVQPPPVSGPTISLPLLEIPRSGLSFDVPSGFRDKENRFEARILFPIVAPTELAGMENPGKIPENQIIASRWNNTTLEPNTDLLNKLHPGGYAALPWRSFQGRTGNFNFKEYVSAYNSLPETDRLITARRQEVEIYSGHLAFDLEEPATFTSDASAGAAGPARRVENVFGRKPAALFTASLGSFPRGCIETPQNDQELKVSFWDMPSIWAHARRRKSFILEIRWKDRATDSVRTYTSLSQGDLGFTVAAPSIEIFNLFDYPFSPQRFERGAYHFEGLRAGENPVRRDISFTVNVRGLYSAFGLELRPFALRIPDSLISRVTALAQVGNAQYFSSQEAEMYTILKNAVEGMSGTTGLLKPESLFAAPSPQPEPQISRVYSVRFQSSRWEPGVYALWFGAQDKNWVSGPLLKGLPGPASSMSRSCLYNGSTSFESSKALGGSIRFFRVAAPGGEPED